MSQLVNLDNTRTMLSTEIATLCDKQHKHVIRDISVILKQLLSNDDSPNLVSGFKSTTYLAGNGKNEKCFELDYEATMIIITGYDVIARTKVIRRWLELEVKKQISLPQSFSEALLLAGKLQAEKEVAEAKVALLTTVIDNEFGYSSILRAAKFLGISEKCFKWNTLKAVTLGLNLMVKRVPSPRYEYQNLYPIKAFQIAYPDYDFDDLKPEAHDDKMELAYI